jgi:hypothetical protein
MTMCGGTSRVHMFAGSGSLLGVGLVLGSLFGSGVLGRDDFFQVQYALARESSTAEYTSKYSSSVRPCFDTSTIVCIFLFAVRINSAWRLKLSTPYLTHIPASNPSCMVCSALAKSPSSSVDAGVSLSTFSQSPGDVDLVGGNGLVARCSPWLPCVGRVCLPRASVAVSLDDPDTLDAWDVCDVASGGCPAWIWANWLRLSLPASMLANAGFLPVTVIGTGICDAVSVVSSLLGLLTAVSIECVALASLNSSTDGSLAGGADWAAGFGVVGGFVDGPVPPRAPTLAINLSGFGTVLRASDMSTRASTW